MFLNLVFCQAVMQDLKTLRDKSYLATNDYEHKKINDNIRRLER